MSTTKYIIAAAGLAAGAAAGNAAAAPILVSKAPTGFTGMTFDGTKTGTLGSFDTSGAGLNTINVNGYYESDSPKVSFSGATGSLIASGMKAYGSMGYTAGFATSYSTLPDVFAASIDNTTGAYVTKEETSNFSSTPLFGETQYTNASGGVSNGYFKGTANGNTFTLLDYGVVTPAANVSAVPEPSEWAMLALGLGGVGAVLRRRRKAADAGMTAALA